MQVLYNKGGTAHKYPASKLHVPSQPSPGVVFPSSHYSLPTVSRNPLPHAAYMHVSDDET